MACEAAFRQHYPNGSNDERHLMQVAKHLDHEFGSRISRALVGRESGRMESDTLAFLMEGVYATLSTDHGPTQISSGGKRWTFGDEIIVDLSTAMVDTRVFDSDVPIRNKDWTWTHHEYLTVQQTVQTLHDLLTEPSHCLLDVTWRERPQSSSCIIL